jgi:hypothetical protein
MPDFKLLQKYSPQDSAKKRKKFWKLEHDMKSELSQVMNESPKNSRKLL